MGLVCGLGILTGCTDGEGTVGVVAYGETFVEDGIPASLMSDGWAVSFHQFDVRVSDVKLAGRNASAGDPVDLSASSSGRGHAIGEARVPVGNHRDTHFSLGEFNVDGTATKASKTLSFAWKFPATTRYTECDASTAVVDGGLGRLEITVHADHLFFDDLASPDPELLFQPLADADQDNDGVITQAELTAVPIGNYGIGDRDGITNVWSYLEALVGMAGHVNGEGHCDPVTDVPMALAGDQ